MDDTMGEVPASVDVENQHQARAGVLNTSLPALIEENQVEAPLANQQAIEYNPNSSIELIDIVTRDSEGFLHHYKALKAQQLRASEDLILLRTANFQLAGKNASLTQDKTVLEINASESLKRQGSENNELLVRLKGEVEIYGIRALCRVLEELSHVVQPWVGKVDRKTETALREILIKTGEIVKKGEAELREVVSRMDKLITREMGVDDQPRQQSPKTKQERRGTRRRRRSETKMSSTIQGQKRARSPERVIELRRDEEEVMHNAKRQNIEKSKTSVEIVQANINNHNEQLRSIPNTAGASKSAEKPKSSSVIAKTETNTEKSKYGFDVVITDAGVVDHREIFGLSMAGFKSDEAAIEVFDNEDKAKIIRMEKPGHHKVVHFKTIEDRDLAFARIPIHLKTTPVPYVFGSPLVTIYVSYIPKSSTSCKESKEIGQKLSHAFTWRQKLSSAMDEDSD